MTDIPPKVTGVSWDKAKGKWIAQICHKQKRKNLGRFNTYEEAVAARKKAEIELREKIISEDLNFKNLLKSKGFTQKEFSKESGVPLRTIENWISGKSKPRKKAIEKIANVLNVEEEIIEKFSKKSK